ncbi:MAG TPA: hypothetical protein VF909_20220, partial [Roseiflexaceae bacterium]
MTVIVRPASHVQMPAIRDERMRIASENANGYAPITQPTLKNGVPIASLTLSDNVEANVHGAKRIRKEPESTVEAIIASGRRSQRRRTGNGRQPTEIKGRRSIVADEHANRDLRDRLR